MRVRFTWSETKRLSNLAKHSLDFRDGAEVFDGPTLTVEDTRFWYGEKRYMTLGFLNDMIVSIIHTENDEEIRLISFRNATKREAHAFLDAVSY